MSHFNRPTLLPTLLFSLLLASGGVQAESDLETERATLGQQLFFDTNLSQNRTQSCASCHDPARGFADSRPLVAKGAVSIGDDGHSHGSRNAPTASYALFAPKFHRDNEGYIGGLFHDGRAAGLADQAAAPPLNPVEMGLTDKTQALNRLLENSHYREAFPRLYGANVLDQADTAYAALTDSIAAFERTELFAPFDSKYDRSLRGEYQMTPQEELGRTLFFSQQFTNCNQCHQLRRSALDPQETFTNYRYHNIGVPANPALTVAPDQGLLDNPEVDASEMRGRFKVPSLRNVAVTAPYMHNGVFQDLRTVVLFYDHYNNRSAKRQINPETNQPWAVPEIEGTLSLQELQSGPALDNRRVDALVAFMKTLTDKRYEHLLTP